MSKRKTREEEEEGEDGYGVAKGKSQILAQFKTTDGEEVGPQLRLLFIIVIELLYILMID